MDRHQWNERYAAQPIVWAVDPAPFLGAEVGGHRAGRALDLGAGEGRTTLWLAERGWQVTAVDFSDVGLDKGRQRAEALGVGANVEWVCADLLEYEPPADRTYDLVLLMFVHLPPADRRRLLRQAAATLNPGGLVLVVGYHPIEDSDGDDSTPRMPNRFTPEEITADLDGLRIERAERLELPDAVDTVVRAVKE